MSPYYNGNICSAINCYNNQKNSPALSFFRFPKNPERSRKWLINCRRNDLSNKDASYLYHNIKLCSDHFEDNQFMNSQKKKLVWNAVPTIFYVPIKPPRATMKRKLPTRIDVPIRKKHKLPEGMDGVDPVPTCRTEDPCTHPKALIMDYPEFPKTEPNDMNKAEDSTLIIDGSGDPALQQRYSNDIKTEAHPPVETSEIEDCSYEEYSSQHVDSGREPEAVYLIMPKVKVEYSNEEGSQEVRVKNDETTDEFPNTPAEEPGGAESYPKLQNILKQNYQQIYQQFYNPAILAHRAQKTSEMLDRAINDWGLLGKVRSIVTDNSANTIAIIPLMSDGDAGVHLPCLVHTLNLAVKKSLESNTTMPTILKNAGEWWATISKAPMKKINLLKHRGS
ncbi:uncharacterized protein [Anabrus simplex]|uniref:uncharacterized protein n=1 Tax=Anabrus simplex TaxID=316456 RepID=UPI0035A3401F